MPGRISCGKPVTVKMSGSGHAKQAVIVSIAPPPFRLLHPAAPTDADLKEPAIQKMMSWVAQFEAGPAWRKRGYGTQGGGHEEMLVYCVKARLKRCIVMDDKMRDILKVSP